MKVLIAEDDATSRNILRAILTRWGYEVMVTTNGIEALEVLRQKDAPKIAVLDWMMPGIDGVEVCRKVRTLENDDPPYLILLTRRDDKADIVEGLSAGASDYIAKPYDIGELQARIEVGKRVIELQDRLHSTLEDLSRQAMTDFLTMAPNRRAILENLKIEMARAMRENTSLWISILDIDHFKGVNDQFGHLAGDTVIKECVGRIQRVIRPYDFMGRWGGDEFMIIIPMTSAVSPPAVFERIRTAIADEEFRAEGTTMRITVSQGVAVLDRNDTMDDLIRKADEALYRVKKSGRNRTECFFPVR
jgi:two-component system, cell cycle response regulator